MKYENFAVYETSEMKRSSGNGEVKSTMPSRVPRFLLSAEPLGSSRRTAGGGVTATPQATIK